MPETFKLEVALFFIFINSEFTVTMDVLKLYAFVFLELSSRDVTHFQVYKDPFIPMRSVSLA